MSISATGSTRCTILSHRDSGLFLRTKVCDTAIDNLLYKKVIILKAPAGYEKTTLVRQILLEMDLKHPGRLVFRSSDRRTNQPRSRTRLHFPLYRRVTHRH